MTGDSGTGQMNQVAFEQLIAEDLAWLETMPASCERSHVREIVRQCVRHYYPTPPTAETVANRRARIIAVLNEDLTPWTFTGEEPICHDLFRAVEDDDAV